VTAEQHRAAWAQYYAAQHAHAHAHAQPAAAAGGGQGAAYARGSGQTSNGTPSTSGPGAGGSSWNQAPGTQGGFYQAPPATAPAPPASYNAVPPPAPGAVKFVPKNQRVAMGALVAAGVGARGGAPAYLSAASAANGTGAAVSNGLAAHCSVGAAGAAGAGANTNDRTWPPSLRAYVERAFRSATDDKSRAAVQAGLKQVIYEANVKGELWTRSWDTTPLPGASAGARVAAAAAGISARLGTSAPYPAPPHSPGGMMMGRNHNHNKRNAYGEPMSYRRSPASDRSRSRSVSPAPEQWATYQSNKYKRNQQGQQGKKNKWQLQQENPALEAPPINAFEQSKRQRRMGRFGDAKG